jgi:GT2 family glycosyltransferase
LVVIGRNEGARLARCLSSVSSIPNRVYVDSGSTDGSVLLARGMGVDVVELPVPPNFTAARARNAGLTRLLAHSPDLQFVQMVDGDCEVLPGWVEHGLEAIEADPGLAAVFGRLRERFPEGSIYNALCDDEWNLPIGEATAAIGITLFRVSALQQVDFYNPGIIAGEDSELSLRLRQRGWRIRRLDVEMALHDAAMFTFRQWWTRTRRSGHGYAELSFLHPEARNPNWPRSARSIVIWGGVVAPALVLTLLLALLVDPRWWLGVGFFLLPWPVRMFQIARRERRRGLTPPVARASGILLMLGKVPQFIGYLGYHRDRLLGRASRLIEHKGVETI